VGTKTQETTLETMEYKERCLFCVRVVLECGSDENDSVSEQETVDDYG